LAEGDGFDALVADMGENGIIEPICLPEGNFLD